MLKLKRIVAMFLVGVLLISTPVTVFAKGNALLEKELNELEKDKNFNLELLLLQSLENNNPKIYDKYKSLLEEEYQEMKLNIINRYNNSNTSMGIQPMTKRNSKSKSYKLSNGGVVTYYKNPYGFERTLYREELFTKSQTKNFIDVYYRAKEVKPKTFLFLIGEFIINVFKVKTYHAFNIYNLIKHGRAYIIESAFREVENSSKKAMRVSLEAGDMGSFRWIRVWSTAPYIYIPNDAINVSIKRN